MLSSAVNVISVAIFSSAVTHLPYRLLHQALDCSRQPHRRGVVEALPCNEGFRAMCRQMKATTDVGVKFSFNARPLVHVSIKIVTHYSTIASCVEIS